MGTGVSFLPGALYGITRGNWLEALLAGIALTTISAAATMLVQYTAVFTDLERMYRWTLGGFTDMTSNEWPTLVTAVVCIVPTSIYLISRSHALNALAAGPIVAASLGVDASKVERRNFFACAILIAVAVGISGPIGFVGLLVPHLCRRLFSRDARSVLVMSGLCGAILLIVCDTIARILLAPDQLPVGVLTALLGAPLFLVLLRKKPNV